MVAGRAAHALDPICVPNGEGSVRARPDDLLPLVEGDLLPCSLNWAGGRDHSGMNTIALGAWERAAWIAAGLLAMVAAGWGLADPTMLYDRLIDPATVPGAFGQDAISAAAGLALVALALAGRRQGMRIQLVALGLLGSCSTPTPSRHRAGLQRLVPGLSADLRDGRLGLVCLGAVDASCTAPGGPAAMLARRIR